MKLKKSKMPKNPSPKKPKKQAVEVVEPVKKVKVLSPVAKAKKEFYVNPKEFTDELQKYYETDIITDNLDSILEYQDYFQSFANIEIINSPLYNLYLVCHGLVDACIIRNDCDFFSQSLSFLAKESKALFKTISNNKKAIITNVKISMPKSIDKE